MFQTVTISSSASSSQSFTAELYEPSPMQAGPSGLVVIVYGTDGLLDTENGPWATMIRGYANSLSQTGISALIPDFFGATGTAPGLQAAAQIASKSALWLKAISDSIEFGSNLTFVDPRRVGILGFSLGGYLGLRLRSKSQYLVEYFAPLFDGIGSGSILIHCQIHHGEDDHGPMTDFSNADAIKRTLAAEGTFTELFPYPGAGHRFVGNDAANLDARDMSKRRTIAFFESHLKL